MKDFKVTMTVGELRELIKDLPDEAEVFADQGDLEYYEVRHARTLKATKEYPAAFALELGQIWNAERDIDARIDDYL